MAVQANEGRSFDSYSHQHRLGEGLRAEGHSYQSVAAVPEPSEWLFLGLGLVLIGAVAYRRQSKLLGK
jgi:hypothetical protein